MITNIEGLRKDKNFTQEEVANNIGVSRQTYSKIEKGDVELTLGQAVKISELFDMEVFELLGEDLSVKSDGNTNWDKYKQIITNCIKFGGDQKDGKIPKTKLAKLCYLVDFGWYYNNLESLSNLSYRKIQYGPVPDAYFSMIDELEFDESIGITRVGNSNLIENISSPSSSNLSDDEIEFIKNICFKWRGKDTKEIVDFTHKQLPWSICEDREIIPYELITQEEPENVY
ncbi:MAG: DUF4065 domain-containing protein [Candidatus Gracilibacteria bacterium]|nr:DUF4065 domain-containing protein [Candidatus Gracilibacteria bacterium]